MRMKAKMSLIVLILIINGNANTCNSCWLYKFCHWLLVILCCTASTVYILQRTQTSRLLFIEISHSTYRSRSSERHSCTICWPMKLRQREETRYLFNIFLWFHDADQTKGIAVILWNGPYYISEWNPIPTNSIVPPLLTICQCKFNLKILSARETSATVNWNPNDIHSTRIVPK